MNAKTLIAAALTATFAMGAFAQEATADDTNFVARAQSTLTRAQVQADVQQARANGTYVAGGEVTVFADAPVTSQRTRASSLSPGRAFGYRINLADGNEEVAELPWVSNPV